MPVELYPNRLAYFPPLIQSLRNPSWLFYVGQVMMHLIQAKIDKTLNTNLNTNVANLKLLEAKQSIQWLAGLGAEVHHQRAEVIRRSSPPHAVSVPFTPLYIATAMGWGGAGPSTWSGCYLTLVVVGLRISMLGGGSGAGCELAPDPCRAAACGSGGVSGDPPPYSAAST